MPDPFAAVVTFIAVAAITPGPNNLIVMAAAARGGTAGALPAMAGVIGGSLALLALVWSGAGAAFQALPPLRPALTLAGGAYLGWLGCALIWRSGKGAPSGSDAGGLPRTALGVAAFQLLNPKAWVLVTTATAAMAADMSGPAALTALAVALGGISACCLALWAWAGSAIGRWLGRPAVRRWFDRAMGGLLVASAVLLVL